MSAAVRHAYKQIIIVFLLRTLVKQEINTLMEEISLAKENGG